MASLFSSHVNGVGYHTMDPDLRVTMEELTRALKRVGSGKKAFGLDSIMGYVVKGTAGAFLDPNLGLSVLRRVLERDTFRLFGRGRGLSSSKKGLNWMANRRHIGRSASWTRRAIRAHNNRQTK